MILTRRTRAREVALQLLFQRDANPKLEREALEGFAHERLRDAELERFCLGLFDGVLTHQAHIDGELTKAATNWRLPRMSAVDRNVLRLGAYELLHGDVEAVPGAVALDEAIEIARRYGGADSPAFVNGVLDKVYRDGKKGN